MSIQLDIDDPDFSGCNTRKRGRPRGWGKSKQALFDAVYAWYKKEHPARIRSACYALFVRKIISSMSVKSISPVYRLISEARELGRLPWSWVAGDDARNLQGIEMFSDPAAFLEGQEYTYRKDFWEHQPRRIEVWIEKAGRVGVISPVLDRYGVDHIPLGGWGPKTTVHDAAERIARLDKPTVILYIGDYDPSGMRMSATDIPTRLKRYGAGEHELVRIALTATDTRNLGTTLSFPATDKKNDPNYPWFVNVKQYGDRCWEVDAMAPSMLRKKLSAAIRARIDWPAWRRCERVQKAEIASLRDYLADYPGVAAEA